ncbi:MAG: trigger factor, partial [Thermoguttaceae bacterium]|nr:trigger factor [Thermoguttaceae bacterium]
LYQNQIFFVYWVKVMAESELNTSEEQKLNLTINVDERSACERHITVTVAREDIDRIMNKEFDELKPVAAIPGFRPGHAPMSVVRSRFRKEIAERAKSAILMEAISQVNDEKNLAPISDPLFDYVSLEIPEKGDFVFEYDLEVRPEFELPNWKGIKIEKPVREFTDADIDAASVSFRARQGKLEESQEGAASGDYITTKLFIRYNDEIINSSEHETIRLRPSLLFSDATIENFDTQMEGVKAGETRTIKFNLSESAPNVLLRGKEVEAVFEVTSVSKLVLPEVNKEFLDGFGFASEEEFRSFLKANLESQMVYQQEQMAREIITEQLLETADWELPPALLERQAERELYRTMYELQRGGFSVEMIQEHLNILRQNSVESTKKALKEHFILERIAESENIDAEEEDYDIEIQTIARQMNESPRKLRARIEKQNQMDILRNQIIERKVIARILENAAFEETTFEPYPEEMANVAFPAGGTGKKEEEAAEDASAEDAAKDAPAEEKAE